MQKFLLFFLFIGVPVFSQQIAMNQADEFTDDLIIQVNASENKKWSMSDDISKELMSDVYISSYYKKSKTGELIKSSQINIRTLNEICFSAEAGSVIFLLENGEKVQLYQISKVDCINNATVTYKLEDEDIQKLSSNKISKCRMYTTDNHIEFEVKNKKKEIILEHFKLFQKTILSNNLK